MNWMQFPTLTDTKKRERKIGEAENGVEKRRWRRGKWKYHSSTSNKSSNGLCLLMFLFSSRTSRSLHLCTFDFLFRTKAIVIHIPIPFSGHSLTLAFESLISCTLAQWSYLYATWHSLTLNFSCDLYIAIDL